MLLRTGVVLVCQDSSGRGGSRLQIGPRWLRGRRCGFGYSSQVRGAEARGRRIFCKASIYSMLWAKSAGRQELQRLKPAAVRAAPVAAEAATHRPTITAKRDGTFGEILRLLNRTSRQGGTRSRYIRCLRSE